MQGTTELTLGFFILQALTVFLVAWIFIFFLIRSRRRRTENLRLFKDLLKYCADDAKLDSLMNEYTEKSLVYMEYMVSPSTIESPEQEILRIIDEINKHAEDKGYKPFIASKTPDKGKLYKTGMIMKQIYYSKK
jgi:hypothetical protein